MLALLAVLQFQLQAPPIATTAVDSLPVVTLPEALRRATGLDPNYVAALGQVDNAVWARRSAFSVFLLPAVAIDRKSTRLNSSHLVISYAVFCLKKKKTSRPGTRFFDSVQHVAAVM